MKVVSAALISDVAAKAGVTDAQIAARAATRLIGAASFAARKERARIFFPACSSLMDPSLGPIAGEYFEVSLERVAVGFTGADAQRVVDRRHENLAVADLAGACAAGDDLYRLVGEVARHRDLDPQFRQEV